VHGVRTALLSMLVVAVACSHRSTTTSARSSFEIREVLATGVGRNPLAANPFTVGVIEPDDPFRHDPAFAEATPGPPEHLVTYADADGDGFYSPGRDPKFVLGPAEVTAADVASAQAERIQGRWAVLATLDGRGARTLQGLTRTLIGRQLAFVFDQVVLSAPTIQSAITSGQLQISGSFGEAQAKQIAAALKGA